MTRLGYRPALDGVRAVAITLVVCVHAFDVPHNGWLGVDLFFVLSGFLITTLLLERKGEPLRRFWGRRARRLLPALFVLLAVYGSVRYVQGRPVTDVVAPLLYATNIPVVTDWMPTRLFHLWSLALEEQFYLVWPLILVVVLRGSRRAGFLAVWVLLLFSLSQDWRLAGHASQARVMFWPDTRMLSIAVGCAIALANSGRVGHALRRAGLLLGPPALLVFAAASFVSVTPATIFRSLLLPLDICAGLAILAALDTRSLFGRVLAVRPLVYLGKLSYGLYLWHIPALMAMGVYTSRGGGQGSTPRELAAVALSLAAAAASYHLVEQPFQRRRRRPAPNSGSPAVSEALGAS